MGVPQDVKNLRQSFSGGYMGTKVFRAAAVDVPNTVWTTIFTIRGGLVLITALMGVRTVIQAGGASNLQFRHSIGATVLCAATAVTADAVGTVYSITGNVADAVQIGAAGAAVTGGIAGGLLATGINMRGVLAMPGTIQYAYTAAGHTGSTRYVLCYIPIDDAADVV